MTVIAGGIRWIMVNKKLIPFTLVINNNCPHALDNEKKSRTFTPKISSTRFFLTGDTIRESKTQFERIDAIHELCAEVSEMRGEISSTALCLQQKIFHRGAQFMYRVDSFELGLRLSNRIAGQ